MPHKPSLEEVKLYFEGVSTSLTDARKEIASNYQDKLDEILELAYESHQKKFPQRMKLDAIQGILDSNPSKKHTP
jgi:hypothetical protein